MLKLIWMSDTHFVAEGDVLGHDPRVRLEAAVEHVNRHHADADMCVISGDLANHGAQADYEGLRDRLGALTVPFFPMVGNHDDRDLLRGTFQLPETCMEGFVQYVVPKSEGRVFCLDTQKTDADAGEFCDERREWLRAELERDGETPAYLFMHHPAHALGLPMQDADRMQGGDEFLEFASSFTCVKYLFIGHVHRPITGVIRGLPFSTMRSALYQAPAPRPAWDWNTFKPAAEAPNIGVVTIAGGDVTIQYEQFCSYELGVS